MDVEEVEEIVTHRFASIMKLTPQKLDLAASLASEYGVDSPKALKLISDVEVEFDIDIEEDEARQIKTLADVIKLIHAKLSQ
jgi:acyl carrier protein